MENLTTSHISVAVAIIINDDGHVLITRRAHDGEHGGFWEFPGGKIEHEETALSALVREIKEEVNLSIHQATLFERIHHQYKTRQVELFVFLVKTYSGVAKICENQLDLRWASSEELEKLPFPEANQVIIQRLKPLLCS